jgi:hypothetical protein
VDCRELDVGQESTKASYHLAQAAFLHHPIDFCFSTTTKLSTKNSRRHLRYFVSRAWFDYFIISVILINCVFLVLPTEYPEAEITFLAVFAVEACIKIVGFAFVPYIKDGRSHPFNHFRFLLLPIFVPYIKDGRSHPFNHFRFLLLPIFVPYIKDGRSHPFNHSRFLPLCLSLGATAAA